MLGVNSNFVAKEKYESTKDEKAGEKSEDNYSTLDLLRGPVLRRNTIIITFIWYDFHCTKRAASCSGDLVDFLIF